MQDWMTREFLVSAAAELRGKGFVTSEDSFCPSAETMSNTVCVSAIEHSMKANNLIVGNLKGGLMNFGYGTLFYFFDTSAISDLEIDRVVSDWVDVNLYDDDDGLSLSVIDA